MQTAEQALGDLPNDLLVSVDGDTFAIGYTELVKKQMQAHLLQRSIEIVRRRVDETGTREPIIQQQGDDRILLQVPGLEDPERLKDLLGQTAKMSFHLMHDTNPFPIEPEAAPAGHKLLRGYAEEDGRPSYYMIKRRVMLSGEDLVDARSTFERGRPVVSFRFNNIGGKRFAEVTKNNVNKPFAIVLDGLVITSPRINEPILGGSGQISGNFTSKSAEDLAILLRAGALPAPLTVLEELGVTKFSL